MRRASIIIMLLAALLMTASCTVGPDNAPEEPETPVEEPGANPGGGGGGGSAGGGSTSSSKEQAAKEFLIGFEPRSFISEGLQAAMEGGDATATIKWNEPEEEVPSSNAAAGPEAGTRQFTVAFTKYNHNDSEVSGDVRYEITLDGTAIQGYKVISSTNLKADGNDISIAFGEDTDPIEAAGMISEDANGKINFADVKVMPVPMGTVVEIKVNDSPTIELDDIFSDIPAVEPTLDDLPGDLNAIRKSIGSLNAYIITRIAEIGNSTGTFPILDVDDVDQEDAYFVVDTYTASNQMTGATAVQPYVSAVHVGVPIDFSIEGDHVYLSGAIDMKTDMSAMSATTEFSDFGAMFIDEEDGSVMMADHLDGMLDESWLSTAGGGVESIPNDLVIGNRAYDLEWVRNISALNSIYSMLCFMDNPNAGGFLEFTHGSASESGKVGMSANGQEYLSCQISADYTKSGDTYEFTNGVFRLSNDDPDHFSFSATVGRSDDEQFGYLGDVVELAFDGHSYDDDRLALLESQLDVYLAQMREAMSGGQGEAPQA